MICLELGKTQSLTDIIHGSIEYSGIEREILGTPIFNRLHRVLQSSLVYLTYSSNKVKRFEHSVGVMDLAGKMFFMSICNTNDQNVLNSFLDDVGNAIRCWRSNVTSEHISPIVPRDVQAELYGEAILRMEIPHNALYRQYTPGNLADCSREQKTSYYVALQAIRLAGLLHDVGHMPYSHVLESSIKNLYKRVTAIPENNRTINQKDFLQNMYSYCDPAVKEKDEIHEEIGKLCSDKIFECIKASTAANQENFFFVAAYDFACSILRSAPGQNTIFSDLHQIIAGVVDADRLDYCSRDALCAGTRTDIINYKRLFSTYCLCVRNVEAPLQESSDNVQFGSEMQRTKRFYFCPHVKNVSLVEDLLRRRWSIFSSINYHHRVHKHEILFEEVISELGYRELAAEERIPELTSGSLPLRVSSIWKLISLLKSNRPPEYYLIQFDDSWLDTLLKKKYFEMYQSGFMWTAQHAQDPMWNRIDELISTQKHYFSIFKRAEEFKQFDELFYIKMCNQKPFSDFPFPIASKLREALDNGTKKYGVFLSEKGTFFFNWIIWDPTLNIAVLNETQQALYKGAECVLRRILVDQNKVEDCILRDCTFKSGCSTGKNVLYVADHGNAKPINNYSNIEQGLRIEKFLSAPFHLYYLPRWVTEGNGYYRQLEAKKDIYPALADAFLQSLVKMCNVEHTEEEQL